MMRGCFKLFSLDSQYNTLYPAQVRAMEERAPIGKPKFFYYMSPNNANWLNESQAVEVESLGLGDHVVSDMHVGAGGGVEGDGCSVNFQDDDGAVNAETNDGTTMTRAAKEASDLNAWFNGANGNSGSGSMRPPIPIYPTAASLTTSVLNASVWLLAYAL